MKIINKALLFAQSKHSNQLDDDGTPYINHPVSVANILKQLEVSEAVIAAGYLHDLLEDTDTTFLELVEEFGDEIAVLVFEVTHFKNEKTNEWEFPYLQSRNAVLLKFADRLHNISRMKNWSEERKEKYIQKSKFWKG